VIPRQPSSVDCLQHLRRALAKFSKSIEFGTQLEREEPEVTSQNVLKDKNNGPDGKVKTACNLFTSDTFSLNNSAYHI